MAHAVATEVCRAAKASYDVVCEAFTEPSKGLASMETEVEHNAVQALDGDPPAAHDQFQRDAWLRLQSSLAR